jgi:hypothetical protein
MTNTPKNSSVLRWAQTKFVDVFGADLRSLAAFRIALALVVLGDLASRATDLVVHYTDDGLMPRTVLLEEVANPWWFSLNLMSGRPFFQALLFGVAALAALGLLIGYRTRLMSFIVWALVLSIQFRNPLLSSAGDVLLHILLFWAMFLPLGAVWSVDRALKAASPRLSMRFLSMATVGLFMQIAFMYWFTAIMKTGREWRVDGTALYYTLSLDRYTSPFGAYLLNYPKLLEVLTFATMGLETFGPFLLFFPFFFGPVRTGVVLAFMSFHFGIWLTMDIGLFPWLAAFCMVCFLPSWFWDKVSKLRDAFSARYDFIRRLQHARARFARAYVLPLRARLANSMGVGQPSFAGLTTPDTSNVLSNYAARMITHPAVTTKTWRGETRPVPPTRPQRGGAAEPTMLRSSLVTNLVALVLVFYSFWWNLAMVNVITMPERVVHFGQFLGIDQNWNMFAPAPDKDDYWFVIPGTLRDGQKTDLMSVTRDDFGLHKVSWEQPRSVVGTYGNFHWVKYLDSIVRDDYSEVRPYFAYYICREWNARHAGAEQLRTFEIAYMWQVTQPDNRHTTPQKVVMWEHSCF